MVYTIEIAGTGVCTSCVYFFDPSASVSIQVREDSQAKSQAWSPFQGTNDYMYVYNFVRAWWPTSCTCTVCVFVEDFKRMMVYSLCFLFRFTLFFPLSVSLFQPLDHQGNLIPDPEADYFLFDRVINVSTTNAVPFGLRGTVIGIYGGTLVHTVYFMLSLCKDSYIYILLIVSQKFCGHEELIENPPISLQKQFGTQLSEHQYFQLHNR